MFPFAPPNAAAERLSALMQEIKQLLRLPAQHTLRASAYGHIEDDDEMKVMEEKQSTREIGRLQRVIESLKQELGKRA